MRGDDDPLLLASAVGLALQMSAFAQGLPMRVGQCSTTRVKWVGTRLDNTPGSGSAIQFMNGGYQVSYDQVAAVDRSRPGDPVRMCLISIPKDCPPGDDRGRFYKTTNLRARFMEPAGRRAHVRGRLRLRRPATMRFGTAWRLPLCHAGRVRTRFPPQLPHLRRRAAAGTVIVSGRASTSTSAPCPQASQVAVTIWTQFKHTLASDHGRAGIAAHVRRADC